MLVSFVRSGPHQRRANLAHSARFEALVVGSAQLDNDVNSIKQRLFDHNCGRGLTIHHAQSVCVTLSK